MNVIATRTATKTRSARARKAAPARTTAKSRKPTPTPKPGPTPPPPGPGERQYILDVPFNERAVASAHGARWYPDLGTVYVGASLPSALAAYLPRAYSWRAWQAVDAAGAAPGNPAADHSTGTFTLRPDQDADTSTVLTAYTRGLPEFLIASKVGTGKTLVAIAAVKRMRGVRNVLVLCPKSVVPNWRSHIDKMGDGGKRWCVINYESARNLLEASENALRAKRSTTKNRRTAKEGTSRVNWDVVITDESHYLTNPAAQRTSVTERLVLGPGPKPAFVLRMSATAGSNPAQMSYLHRGLAVATGTKPRKSITSEEYQQWCARQGIEVTPAPFGSGLTWDKTRREDLNRMRRLVFDASPTWALRREPDWPEQQRIPMPIDLDAEEIAAYNAEWDSFQTVMREVERVRAAAARSGTPAAKRAGAAARAKGLAAQIRYRQKAGQVRAAHTARFVADLVAKGHQVAVSCEFLGTVERVVDELRHLKVPTVTFTGANPDTREDERIAYQRGHAQVIVFTPAEGFNLHAGDRTVGGNDVPRATVVAEPRWSPKKALQVEGRSQRDGTAAPTYYLYASNTVEENVIRTVVAGMQDTEHLHGSDTAMFAGLAAALGVSLVGETAA